MAKPIIHDGIEQREMSKAEHDQWLELVADIEARALVADQIAAAKMSAYNKLKNLGLNDEEIAALVG